MSAGDITAEVFSNRKVCLSRAREHLGNRAYRSARTTLERGARQWQSFAYEHDYLTVLGQVAWRQGALREARRCLRMATRSPECHVEARYLLGRVLLDLGEMEEAVSMLAGLLRDEDALVPYRVHAGGALSVAYAALGLNKSSQDALEDAAEFDLVSAQLLADEGFRLMRIGAHPEAEVQLAKALQVDNSCEDAFLRLCDVLFVQGKVEPAMEVLAFGIEQSPDYPPYYRLMSEFYTSRDHHKEAAAFLKRAIELCPEADDADLLRFMMGQALYRIGRTDAARTEFRGILDDHPRTRLRRELNIRIESLSAAENSPRKARLEGFPRKLQRRAYCAPNTMANVLTFVGVSAGQDEVAARVMRGAGTHWPEVFDYFQDMDGVAWRGYFGTLELLKQCIDAGMPVITTEYYGMSGHALAIVGYDDEAELLIAQDPRFLEPVEVPYRVFERSWEHDDGICIAVAPVKDRKKLPEQSPEDEQLMERFMDLLRLRNDGQHEPAMHLALALHDDAPTRQTPLRIMAEIALQMRGTEQLQALCEEALETWPHCFWARRYLGDALWMQDKADEALVQYRKAHRLDRRDPALAYAMGELLLSRGDRRRGRARLLAALREDARYHRARLRLAEDMLEAGERKAATFHARLVVEFDPDFKPGREMLETLLGKTEVMHLSDAARRVAKEVAAAQASAAMAAELDDDEELEIDLENL
jgi:tetratricopeptide (TPR) repeat protein